MQQKNGRYKIYKISQRQKIRKFKYLNVHSEGENEEMEKRKD